MFDLKLKNNFKCFEFNFELILFYFFTGGSHVTVLLISLLDLNMSKFQDIFVILAIFVLNVQGDWTRVKTGTDPNVQEEQVRSLLQRAIPSHCHLFNITILTDSSHLLDRVSKFEL